MKKTLVIITFCVLAATLCPAVSHATDVSIGASTWYTWWKMTSDGGSGVSGPALCYGPNLSVRLSDNWSLSGVFLYGRFDIPGSETQKINRFDSDTLLNYSFNRYIKVFGGFKYLGFTFSGGHHWGYGGGLGIGLTLPLSSQWFLLGNISGLYVIGNHKDSGSGSNYDFKEPGMNAVLALAYYVESWATTLTLGYRGQFIWDRTEGGTNNARHDFNGVTCSAVYSFDL